MTRFRHLRNSDYETVHIRVLLIAFVFLGILVARNLPPHFPRAASTPSAISALSHHDQRPRFDHPDSRWGVPSSSFVLLPPAAQVLVLQPVPQLFSTLQTKGFHYNRPPPHA